MGKKIDIFVKEIVPFIDAQGSSQRNTPRNTHDNPTLCNRLQQTAIDCDRLQQTATDCNKIQQTATDCNRLQQTATKYNTLQH